MIAELNRLIDAVEEDLAADFDVGTFAARVGTTEYHLRRMFASMAGMPLSDYVRRRRMSLAAADVIGGAPLLDTAVRSGYGSTEAFGRAFRAVHGASPAQVRADGGPLRSQPRLRLRLTVEGKTSMETRIAHLPPFTLVGHSARVPLVHRGVNSDIQEFIASLPVETHARLKELSHVEPAGLLQISADVDPDYREGSELTYMHGVARAHGAPVPEDLDTIDVPAGQWAVFRSSGPYPQALQDTYEATATEWFPSNPSWRLRSGPSIVAVIERADDFSTATTELWMPIEGA